MKVLSRQSRSSKTAPSGAVFYFEASSSAQSAPVFRKTQRGEIPVGQLAGCATLATVTWQGRGGDNRGFRDENDLSVDRLRHFCPDCRRGRRCRSARR